MKQYKITLYFILIVAAAITGGCTKKYLQPEPLSFYTPENTYNTPAGLTAALQAAAKNMWAEQIGGPQPYTTQLFFSDEAVNGTTDNTTAKDLAAQLNPDDGSLYPVGGQMNIQWYWRSVYIGIKYANTVVTYIDLPKWDTTQTAVRAQRNSILGGAYFWRAYCYYYLTNCFGDVPWVGKLYTEPKLNFSSTKREVILKKIRSDLQYAALWVPDNVSKGQVTKGAVLHLLAKVNLALGNFDDAIANATQIINGGTYKLMTNRFGINASDATKNVIWDLHRPENMSLSTNTEGLLMLINRENLTGNLGANTWIRNASPYWSKNINTPNGNIGTSDAVGISIDLDTQYGRGICFVRPTWYSTHLVWGQGTNSAGDLRHAPGNWMRMEDLVYNSPALLTIKTNGVLTPDPYYGKPLQKYSASGALLVSDTIRSWFEWPHYKLFVYDPNTATSSQAGGYSDEYIFRLAETYLIRAEAEVWKGDLPKAMDDINVIRARAKAGLFTDPSQITIGTILDERARELYYEEERKIELTRISYLFAQTGQTAPTGKTYNMANFSTSNFWYDWIALKNDFYNKGVVTGIGSKYTLSPYFVLWPVPTSAIAGNTQGIINQNTGYTGTSKNIPPLTTITE